MAHAHSDKMMTAATTDQRPRTAGIVLHSPVLYDFTVWLAFFPKEQAFREKVLNLACIAPGECVLDVGCGTGTLAIAAKRRVGDTGAVHGIDASVEMLARAERKARKAGVEVLFLNGLAEALPFPDVTSTPYLVQ
jgi:ubiquinone/menaquinone biosynthesis C-methylase UbiE